MLATEILFIDESLFGNIRAEDKDGFTVVCYEPDHTGCVPVKRIYDGEYFCLPLRALIKKLVMPSIKITFSLNTPFRAARITNLNTSRQGCGNAVLFSPSYVPTFGLDMLTFEDNEGQPSLMSYTGI